MSTKPSVDLRGELAELVKRKAEIAVSQFDFYNNVFIIFQSIVFVKNA